ncbi:MAG TPA: 30S ribosomal protein S9 [Candidatus Paceibacterota bacterium]|jgi:small subunit ribosomal protein S9|nr:30S ribosomal protein S9 [Candidatus Paceibacterota bacterium]HRS47691.1 30S ribosomal protein S9 [Candidatus Paceibacterota bacterium]
MPKKTTLKTDSNNSQPTEKYFRALGRRKEAIAIAKLYPHKGSIIINQKPVAEFFKILEFQKIVEEPLKAVDSIGKFEIEVKVNGGGIRGQAEAIKLAISRALVKFNPEFKPFLKKEKLLTRDARVKERKKFGLKKARRAPQWSKR